MVIIESAGIKEKFTNVKLGCFSMVFNCSHACKRQLPTPFGYIIKTMKNYAE